MVLSRNEPKQPVQVAKYVPKLSEVKRLEIEQKKNIMLLVENMMQREAATFKMIIDCLYDLGSLNFINKKVSLVFFKFLLRLMAKLAKNIFRSIAFYWVVNNTPELITNWLLNKIMISANTQNKKVKAKKKLSKKSKAKKGQKKSTKDLKKATAWKLKENSNPSPSFTPSNNQAYTDTLPPLNAGLERRHKEKTPVASASRTLSSQAKPSSKYLPKLSKAQKLEIEQKKNVMLLVENLMEREEATFKMIIDCLYDLGSLNLINQKVSVRPLNRVIRLISRLSKSSFRAIAFYWVKKNTPELITDWLLSKVRF